MFFCFDRGKDGRLASCKTDDFVVLRDVWEELLCRGSDLVGFAGGRSDGEPDVRETDGCKAVSVVEDAREGTGTVTGSTGGSPRRAALPQHHIDGPCKRLISLLPFSHA